MPNLYTSPLTVSVADGTQILNSTTEALMAPSYAFAANDSRIFQGAAFNVRAWFDVSNVVTTPGTLQFWVRWGGLSGTTLCTSAAIQLDTTARSNYSGFLDADLVVRSIGSSGSIWAQGIVFLNNVAAGAAAAPQWHTMTSAGENVPAVAGSLNFTSTSANAQDLALTAKFSVNTATTQLTCHNRIITSYTT